MSVFDYFMKKKWFSNSKFNVTIKWIKPKSNKQRCYFFNAKITDDIIAFSPLRIVISISISQERGYGGYDRANKTHFNAEYGNECNLTDSVYDLS